MLVSSSPFNPWQVVKRYSIITSSVSIVALDALLFASKVIPSMPLGYSRFALLGLSFAGLQAIPYWLHFIEKLLGDTAFALRERQFKLAILVSLKALMVFTNMGLILASAWAAWCGEKGDLTRQTELYHQMTPVGLASLALGLFLLFSYLALNIQALDEADTLEPYHLTALQRAVIDKDTLEVMLKHPDPGALRETVIDNLKTQLKYVQGADLGFQILGFILQAFEKIATPDSAFTSGTNLLVSFGFFLKIAREKRQEYLQREAIASPLPQQEILPSELRLDHTLYLGSC